MKRIIFLIITLSLLVSPVYANQIKKIGQNHVEVQELTKAIDINGNKIKVYDSTKKKQHYGQKKLTRLKIRANKKLLKAQNLDAVQYKNNLIAKRQKEVDKIIALPTIIPSKIVKDKNGNDVQVFITDSEAFEELVSQMPLSKKLLKEAQALDEVQYKNDLIKKWQDQVDGLNLIQIEMDK